MGNTASPSGRRRRVVRAVPVAAVAYSTHAPQGHTCGDCKSLISPDVRVVRLSDDHIVNGQACPDYRHITCFYSKELLKTPRRKATP